MKLEEIESKIYQWQGKQIQGRGVAEAEAHHKKSRVWSADRLTAFLPKDKSAKIIDVPCGDGTILYFLKESGYTNVTGWDIAEGRVAIAQQMGLNAKITDAFEALPKEKDCSIIFSIDFLEHIDKTAAVEFLQTCNDALIDGGLLIVRTPVTDSFLGSLHLYNDFTHRWATNSGVWRAIAGATGFQLKICFDERPIPSNLKRTVARILFECARFPLTLLYRMLGQGVPRVWSPSVWFILEKNQSA